MDEPSLDLARFELKRLLGSGGFGAVYEARDRTLNESVALKVLRVRDARALQDFKREFRLLAELRHGNLVSLYELHSEGDAWFFTMELLDGARDFVSHAWNLDRPEQPVLTSPLTTLSLSPDTVTLAEPLGSPEDTLLDAPAAPGVWAHDASRLVDALAQLASGLDVLHRAGRLHRDVKPSNVLADSRGRVVLVDFGLSAETANGGAPLRPELRGTPLYMAPEQLRGEYTPASDWYAVGVMLFKTLTGRMPFKGGAIEVMRLKQSTVPAAPDTLVQGLPPGLSDLCMQLLAAEPAARPSAVEVRQRLGRPLVRRRHTTRAGGLVVGRDRELEILDEALGSVTASQPARTVIVRVQGESGSGKTSLCRAFLDGVRRRLDAAWVFAGRCSEAEIVPYMALDGVVDQLAEVLATQPRPAGSTAEASREALVRLFPVLAGALGTGAPSGPLSGDPHEHRQRGARALRELLVQLSQQRPVVIFVDDVQWGDADSRAVLRELVAAPSAPRLLLVVAHRWNDPAADRFVDDVAQASTLGEAPTQGAVVQLAVDALDADAARDIVHDILGAPPPSLVDAVLREAAGNAFVVTYLAATLNAAGGAQEPSLDMAKLVAGRVAALPAPVRRLLEVLCVAGHGLSVDVARVAAGLEDTYDAVASARAARVVREGGYGSDATLEPYHDRLRSLVLPLLSKQAQLATHRAIAEAYDAVAPEELEARAMHWAQAGDPARAATHSAAAAGLCERALAFEQAARLYAMAIDLDPSSPEAAQLSVRRGDALANAWLGLEAAEAYLEAARRTGDAPAKIALELRAAEQLVTSGHVKRGSEMFAELMPRVGLSWPGSRVGAITAYLLTRARVKLLGAEVELPPPRAATADELLRVDVAHAAAAGLVPVDPLRGLMFQSRYLLLALEAGEPHRIGRAIALEAATCIIDGNINAERARALSRRAMLMGERLGDPRIIATALLAEGVIHLFEGQFRPSISFFEKAEALARERCRGMAAAVFNCACLRLWGLRLVGDMQGLRAGIPRLLDDAMRRGDIATQANVRGESLYCLHLADDRPDAAARELETMNETWTGEGYDSVRYWFLRGSVEVALYEGRFAEAWSLIERAWPRLRFSSAFAVQAVRVEALEIRARAALALAQVQKGSERFALRRIARDALMRMERENIAWGNTLAELHLCALDMNEGASAELVRRLEAVSAFFEEREMRFHECAARERLGRLTGKAGIGYGTLAACGVKAPERMLRVIAPG